MVLPCANADRMRHPASATFRSQNGLAKKVDKSRKQKKERRNRTKKIRGSKKHAGELC